ncbi:MAG: hypothetical protein ACJ72X_03200 [Nitrososphaeraceae archaeon]
MSKDGFKNKPSVLFPNFYEIQFETLLLLMYKIICLGNSGAASLEKSNKLPSSI